MHTNGAVRVLSAYDHRHRRVRKTVQRLSLPDATPPMPPPPGEWNTTETHTYFYDDWNLVEERIARADGTASTNRYIWGKDLSGSLQGAGGVGGLLAVIIDGSPYFPAYDHNGNVTRYLDSSGATVAAYAYDAFGNTISATGPLADAFAHRFSTKYFDSETGLSYYGYRFYSPELMRWLSRDPIEEDGGSNLYHFCLNNPFLSHDFLGLRNLCDCLSIQVRVSRRCNWSSVWAARRFRYIVQNDTIFNHTTKARGHGSIPHYDSLEQLEVLVDMLNSGKDSCCDSVGYSTFVTIDSVGFHENKSPWSYGYTMEGKQFSNNHVTANLMPREVEGSQKTFKIRVWIDSDDGEVDCLKRSVTVRY